MVGEECFIYGFGHHAVADGSKSVGYKHIVYQLAVGIGEAAEIMVCPCGAIHQRACIACVGEMKCKGTVGEFSYDR